MSEAEEGLYAELATSGRRRGNLHRDVTSQLSADVELPDGHAATADAGGARPRQRRRPGRPPGRLRRRAGGLAAGRRAVRGGDERGQGRGDDRQPPPPVGPTRSTPRCSPTPSAARRSTPCRPRSTDALGDFRRWMRAKAVAPRPRPARAAVVRPRRPLPGRAGDSCRGTKASAIVRNAFAAYSPQLGGLVDRALDEQWIDAAPRDGKVGGAFCMPFVGDRSLVLLNWTGSADSAQTTAHELGHAYHNTTLAERTHLQRRLPMALAETASIFCETLVVESGLQRLDGAERLALLDVDLQGRNQVVVDIHSRFLFESEVFARRGERTLGVTELNELMLEARPPPTATASTSRRPTRTCGSLKPHYYGAHFYNWPYTYGLLFGLGLFARYREDPERFRSGLRDAALARRDGHGRGARRGVRARRHRRSVLDGEPRRDPGAHRRLRAPRRRASADERRATADGADRRATAEHARDRWHCSQTSRATASTRCGRASTSSLRAPAEMTNLPRRLRERLDRLLPTELTRSPSRCRDGGDTVKFLSALDGGYQIETVLMLYPDRATVCVSSQAGCAMGCGFCATGQAGFDRQLATARSSSRSSSRPPGPGDGRRLSNVVFMGMGEPLANEAAVWAAIERLHGALGLSARHITLSTVGIVPGIRALAAPLPVNLAVCSTPPTTRCATSSCRSTAATRSTPSCRLPRLPRRDRPPDQLRVGADRRRQRPPRRCRRAGRPVPPFRPAAHVNLIPLNPTPGWPTTGSPAARVHQFRDLLTPSASTHGAPQPRHRHRRRVRPAGRPPSSGSAAGSAAGGAHVRVRVGRRAPPGCTSKCRCGVPRALPVSPT